MLSNTRTMPTTRRTVLAAVAVSAVFAAQLSAMASSSARGSAWKSVAVVDPGLSTVGDALQQVVVSTTSGVQAAVDAVRAVGGSVEAELPIIGGVEAEVPASRLVELSRVPGVVGITKDREGAFVEYSYDEESVASGFTRSTEATAAWAGGNLGAGVGVAILDTGVSPMNDFAGRLVHGPDLSGEGTVVDSYGHGTVMAGAMGASGADSATSTAGMLPGVAPKSTIVAVKVAGRNGAVDVSTILQGMHWVSAYKDQFNIRVMNLSWGVPSTQDPKVDPLNYAVQRLWKQGIVVVVAAGNSGSAAGTIMKPGDDPLVLTVGAYNDKGTARLDDDAPVQWTSRGPTAHGLTKPDLVAPGKSLSVSRSFGSKIEIDNPKALIAPSYIRGSGSSQAAAVTSGLAALLIAARPSLTPDQVKHLLTSTAVPMANGTPNDQGKGRIRIARALTGDPLLAPVQAPTATGLGSIEASRGGYNVYSTCNDVDTFIQGEIDVMCEKWNPAPWVGSSWRGEAWTGSSWRGAEWTGSSWRGLDWSSATWDGSSWRGGTWAGSSWRNEAWTGSAWKGSAWRGSSWRGSSWRGSSWRTADWTSAAYDEYDGFTSSAYDDATEDGFLAAWFGNNPPWTKSFPGEKSDPAPSYVTEVGCVRPEPGSKAGGATGSCK